MFLKDVYWHFFLLNHLKSEMFLEVAYRKLNKERISQLISDYLKEK